MIILSYRLILLCIAQLKCIYKFSFVLHFFEFIIIGHIFFNTFIALTNSLQGHYNFVCLFAGLSVCPSEYLYVCLSVYPSVSLSLCLFISLFVCLSVCLNENLD